MMDVDPIASLRTRRQVRGFLARGLNDLVGDPGGRALPVELCSLATGDDSDVMESYQRLERLCESRSATDAKYSATGVGHHLRELFAKALHRMNELPPDARETLHVKPRTSGTI